MRPVARWVVGVGVVLACAACGGTPELAADRARTLQESVLTVTQAAGEGRWADAQVLLADTQTALDAGADAGEVSVARYREIDAALDRVAAELAAAQAAADQAAAQAAQQQAALDQAAQQQAVQDQAAQDEAAPEPKKAPAPAKEPPAPKDKAPKGKK